MNQTQFQKFLASLHRHVEQNARPQRHQYDIGYAIGKLVAHYKHKYTEIESHEFDMGISDGVDVGSVTKVH